MVSLKVLPGQSIELMHWSLVCILKLKDSHMTLCLYGLRTGQTGAVLWVASWLSARNYKQQIVSVWSQPIWNLHLNLCVALPPFSTQRRSCFASCTNSCTMSLTHTHRLWIFYLVVVLPSFDFCSLSALSSFCRFGYFVISKTGDWHQQKMNTMVSTPFRFLQHRNIFPICQNFAGSSPRSRTSRNPLKALAAIWAAAAR